MIFHPRRSASTEALARRAITTLVAALALTILLPFARANADDRLAVSDLADMSLEQLSHVEVTSVSRKAERLSDAAATVYVISAEDIRRSGATRLAEALRLAPNLHVARADANQWAISSRGFNSVLANKMLVMIDGRTIYSPLFSGVFWEAHDVMLEDIERIEVVSGAGGTLWGTNAVNGVINIITRPAEGTQGVLASGSIGHRDRTVAARYGTSLTRDGHLRVYGKLADLEPSERPNGTSVPDGSGRGQAGFRADWGNPQNKWTLQGDTYLTDIDQVPGYRRVSGGNLLGRWSRTSEEGGGIQILAYYDRSERFQPLAIDEKLDTFEGGFQHAFRAGVRHDLLWGAGYRHQIDRVENLGPALAFIPGARTLRFANVFAQDDIALADQLSLTLGIKGEYNVFTDFEYLPNVRLAWKVDPNTLLWGAASRAVRAPSRIDRELFSPASPPHFALAGGPNFDSEISNTFEVGYRAQPTLAVAYSVWGFFNDHDHLRSLEPSPAGPVFENRIQGTTRGAGASGSWRVTDYWKMSLGTVQMKHDLEPGSASIGGTTGLGNDPAQWWTFHSAFNVLTHHELDIMVREVGALPNPHVPGYTAVDVRLGLEFAHGLNAAVTGFNLFDEWHPEWGAPGSRPEFRRGVRAELSWRK